jgi:AcrR family transcriptional regulator
MAEKLDRRVRRTRRRLRDALIELVLEKGYDNVTNQEITDRADLSRATFYLHYKNGKDELLASSLESMFDELVDSVQDSLFQHDLDWENKEPPSLPAFQHVAEYAKLYKALLGDKGVTSVIYRTLNYIARISQKQFQLIIEERGLEQTPIPVEVAAQHIAGSLFSMMSWWLENDMPYPPEEMARIYHFVTVPGIRAALGLPLRDTSPDEK